MVLSSHKGWSGSDRPPPLIYVHGAGQTTINILDGLPLHGIMFRELANYFTVAVCDFGGDKWGTTEHTGRIDEIRAYLASDWGTSGLVTLVGVSMGGLGAINYGRHYPNNVRAISAIMPVLDMVHFKANFDTPGGVIDTQYGYPGTSGYVDSVHGSQHNPTNYGSAMTAPLKVFYSNTDTVTPSGVINAYAAARPATTFSMVGTAGHTDQTIGDSTAGVVQFSRFIT